MNEQSLKQLYRDQQPANASSLLALAQADPRTVAPIRLDELRPLLASQGILGKLARAALADDGAANAYAYINSANVTIRSDLPDYAAQLNLTMAGLTMLGLTADQRTAVIALGGGYTVMDATAEQCQAAIDAVAAEDAFAAKLAEQATRKQAAADRWNAYCAAEDALSAGGFVGQAPEL